MPSTSQEQILVKSKPIMVIFFHLLTMVMIYFSKEWDDFIYLCKMYINIKTKIVINNLE